MLKKITSVDRNFARKKWSEFSKIDKLEIAYMIIFVIIFVALTVTSVLLLSVNIIAACAMMILQGTLAVLLSKLPLWAHVIVFALEILVGYLAGCLIFMALAGVVYLSACGLLYIWRKDDENELPETVVRGLTDADVRNIE